MVEIKAQFWTNLGQLSAIYKSWDKGRESTVSVVFIKHYFEDSAPKDRYCRNNDIVTLKRANTNVHIGTREMNTQEMEVEEDTG